MFEDEYAKEKLVWVTNRLEILDEVDKKLKEMKRMAEYALDNEMQTREKEELNRNIKKLREEVLALYEKDRNFWL
jgi:hypothetical protein